MSRNKSHDVNPTPEINEEEIYRKAQEKADKALAKSEALNKWFDIRNCMWFVSRNQDEIENFGYGSKTFTANDVHAMCEGMDIDCTIQDVRKVIRAEVKKENLIMPKRGSYTYNVNLAEKMTFYKRLLAEERAKRPTIAQ